MEPITLLVLGAVGIYAFTRKKRGPAGPAGPKIFTFTAEGLLGKEESIAVHSGDTIKVLLPGLREQWTLDIVGGEGLTLDKMFAIESIGERGVVTYTLAVVGEDMPWNSLITFNLLQEPYVKLAVSYVP